MNPPIDDKLFRSLQAQAALMGMTLHRSDPADGEQVYFLQRFGLTRQQTAQDILDLVKEGERDA